MKRAKAVVARNFRVVCSTLSFALGSFEARSVINYYRTISAPA